MSLVDLTDAIDLHIHSNPSLFTRSGSDLDMAQHAASNQLRAIVLKNHFESTVGRAHLADLEVEATRVFGGLVLNHFAGGINPVAVEHAIRLGARQIWMPTIDAAAHADAFGKVGGYGYQDAEIDVARNGITILDGNGNLVEVVKVIVERVKEAGVILGTAHLSKLEIYALARFAKEAGFRKLLVTHPYFDPPGLSVSEQAELAELGASIELCGGNLYPIPGVARLSDYLHTISQVDLGALVVSSDSGQPRKSMPAEVLRVFTQCLMEKGVTQQQVNRMSKVNPARLLDLS